MSLIPDPYKRKIRLSVRIKNDRIYPVKDEIIPHLKDGTIVDLIVPSYALESEKDKLRFTTKTKRLLAKGTTLKCLLFHQKPFSVEMRLDEDLFIEFKGDDGLGRCRDCRCAFQDKFGKEISCSSLNEAYFKASQIYEPERRSHSGNVFNKILYSDGNGREITLDNLRVTIKEDS